VIGSLLRVAASAAAGISLRVAAHDATTRFLLSLGAGAALAVGAACLTRAALVLLRHAIDPAGVWAIVGVFWGLVGLFYFVAISRRRG
jgi:hypothetical protein